MAYSRAANHTTISDTDWSDQNSIAQTVRELLCDSSYKEREERLAVRNEAFLFGDHWYEYSKSEGKMVPSRDKPGWQARLVYNDILVSVENRIAKYVREKRVWNPSVEPGDLEDKVVHKRQSQVLGYAWDQGLKMNAELRRLLQWCMSSSICYGHCYWDRDKGPPHNVSIQDFLLGVDTIPDPVARENYVRQQTNRFFQLFGQEALQAGEYNGYMGDVCFDVAPIFEVGYWPFNIKKFSDAQIVYRRIRKSVPEVAEMLGVTNEEVRSLAQRGQFGRANSGESIWQNQYYWDSNTAGEQHDDVLVTTVWRKPSKAWPKGRQCIVLGYGDHALEPTDLRNPLNIIPVRELVEIPIRGKVMGTCTVDQLRPAQEHLNSSMSWAADYQATRVSPTLVDPVGNEGLNPEGSLSNKPGKIHKIANTNSKPEAIRMPEIPVDYFRMSELDRIWMSKISGVASIDTGSSDDANVRSGRALAVLREQNDLRLIPFGQALDEFMSWLGNLVLAFYQENVATERIIHITGEDGRRSEIVKFRGADLRPSNYRQPGYNEKPIKVNAFSLIPKSPQELSGFLNTALTAQSATGHTLIDPVKDRNEVFEIMGMGHMRKLFDRDHLDHVRQSEEIERWESGQPNAPPRPEDNDAVHIEDIEKWKKTDAYEVTAYQYPMIAMQVEEHLKQHRINQIKKQIEPQYNVKRADVSLWMENRAQLAADLAKGNPDLAPGLVNLMFPAPMTAVMPAPADGGGQQDKPANKSSKPAKQDKSANQGVSKQEQTNADAKA